MTAEEQARALEDARDMNSSARLALAGGDGGTAIAYFVGQLANSAMVLAEQAAARGGRQGATDGAPDELPGIRLSYAEIQNVTSVLAQACGALAIGHPVRDVVLELDRELMDKLRLSRRVY